jgi:hypothetical protein
MGIIAVVRAEKEKAKKPGLMLTYYYLTLPRISLREWIDLDDH